MEQYGCTVANRFAWGDIESEDEDPFESLKKLENKKKEEKEKSTQKAKEQKEAKNKATKKESEVDAKKGLQPQNNKSEEILPRSKEGSAKPVRKTSASKEENVEAAPAPRGGPRGRGRGGPRGGRTNQENLPPAGDGGAAAPRAEGGEVAGGAEAGRGRGRGGFRGARGRGTMGPVRGGERGGGRGGGRGGFGGNREFDRQSADPKAMVKPTEKREGGGKGNWGTTQDVIDDVAAPAPVEAVEAPEEDKEAVEAADPSPAPAEAEATAPEVEEEIEPEEMTLDEWKALQEQAKPKSGFNLRRAGEGVDDSQWGDMVALKKKAESSDEEDDDDDDDNADDEDEAEKKGKKKAGKQVLDIKLEFADAPQRGGRGRGFGRGRGRGEGRGGRGGRGQARGGGGGGGGGPKVDAFMEIDNQKEFPSLGGAPKAVTAAED